MYCTCNERNQWMLNDRNLSSSIATLPRKSHENLAGKKSALKPANRTSTTPKKTVKTIDNRLGPRSSTLPRSHSRARPHVATIFNNSNEHQRGRRQSEVIP